MNKIFLILIFFLTSCGYQSIYANKNVKNLYFQEINLQGDEHINKVILDALKIEKDEQRQDKLYISSSHLIEQSTKDSKGQIVLFKTIISVNLEIKNIDNKIVQNKKFIKEFNYKNKKNKFELVEYQHSIKNDLTNKIISEIIIYLNS